MITAADFAAKPFNEPVLEYRPGSEERKLLDAAIAKYAGSVTDIPVVIGDEEIRNGEPKRQVMVSFILSDESPRLPRRNWMCTKQG